MIIANELHNKIIDIVNFIKGKLTLKPDFGIILGSGLGELVDDMEDKIIIPYTDIVHIPKSTAPGHFGNLYQIHKLIEQIV
ncbi:MAG: hypothetical protein K2P99_07465 [Burkholderiales bacterium]|nr:hypothetical protein [Burkholderiales bacterium]